LLAGLPADWRAMYIYCATNIKTRTVYIGQTKDFRRRVYHHLYTLKGGTHRNKFLQADYNEHDECDFSFTVLEEVSEDQADERETYWINNYWKLIEGIPCNIQSFRLDSKMDQMPKILNRIRKKGIDKGKCHLSKST
jgi:group I intron endonuclease